MYPTSSIYFPLNDLTTMIARLSRRIPLRMNMQCVRGVAIAAFAVSAACAVAFSQGISNNVASRVTPARLSPPGAVVEDCKTNNPNHILPAGTRSTDLQINGINCIVDGTAIYDKVQGSYVYRNVNIYNGGTLTFKDALIDFHAHSILVEMKGTLAATGGIKGPVTIWLWGQKEDGIPSITCLSDANNQCGIPNDVWTSNLSMKDKKMPMGPCNMASKYNYKLPGGDDCFYQYDVLDAGDKAGAYFGRKVLAVSAGGNLMLQGAKGIRTGRIEDAPGDSSTSWARLTTTLNGGETRLYLDRSTVSTSWAHGDHIVVTTTDYLPGHTEEFVIDKVTSDNTGHTWIDIDTSKYVAELMRKVQYPHWGDTYDYSDVVAAHPGTGPAPDPNRSTLPANNIETRAIVALLSRSITIASEGPAPVVARTLNNQPYDHFPPAAGFYGGHTIVRQGFNTYQVQGVEFYELGQGGMLGRYPVHFHMDRTVPQYVNSANMGTYVADCSIVDSMTRFITVHATQGVTLARNVGYKSIGHGYYLEDATETNNRLYSNVGISVRGALDGPTNPRNVPGILDISLADLNNIRLELWEKIPDDQKPPKPVPLVAGNEIPDVPPYVTDVTTPSVFWIMNTWNDFQYNVAVGAGVCGACYWMPPGMISGPSRYETWTGYASMEKDLSHAGATPLLNFKGNSCSAAMFSIVTVGATNDCHGVKFGLGKSVADTQLVSILNTNSPERDKFPQEDPGQRAKPTVCNSTTGDCSTVPPCTGQGPNEKNCAATVIDRYTTSFNWAPTNFSAVWLRGWWYLMDNSAITDVQNGGLTLVSGGGYSRSDAAQGYWSVLKNSILVGSTQMDTSSGLLDNPFASNAGPFNEKGGLTCPYSTLFCLSVANGIVFLNAGFSVNQRLFNIYDGPAAEYNNIYANIKTTDLGTVADCRGPNWETSYKTNQGNCDYQKNMNGYTYGVRQYPPTGKGTNHCILPNAAIAWKQPNGFYYPPSFNSENLVFKDVDIRHFVILPLYKTNSFEENEPEIINNYCTWNKLMFKAAFTDIDRQTELTDIDGSLTGLTANIKTNTPSEGPTISVNKDAFYNVPLVTDECASGQPTAPGSNKNVGATVNTSPYEYLTTALVAECARQPSPSCNATWTPNICSTPDCYGVPLYRESLTAAEKTIYKTPELPRPPSIRLMGQASAQRSTMTVNHAKYYIDTTLSKTAQLTNGPYFNVFQQNGVYDVFFLYATKTTKQSYSLFVGKGLTDSAAKAVLTPGRMPVPDNSFPFNATGGTWANVPDGGYNTNTGILTVNVDLSKTTDLDVASRKDFCQPTTSCAWDSTKNICGCKKVGGKCVNANVDDNVCSYATRDLDCPVAGCYGFRITLPSAFPANLEDAAKAGNVLPPPPDPGLYTDDPYFQKGAVTFVAADQDTAGSCWYSPPPTQQTTRDLLMPTSERLGSEDAPNH